MPDIHNTDPAENLHNMAQSQETKVDGKFVQTRLQSSLVTEDDRKTGKVSDAANSALRGGTNVNS